MLKKLILGAIGVIIVLVVAVVLLGSNLDSLIKTGIEKYGSLATQTDIVLDKVQISLSSGKGTLQGFRMANPKGFSSNNAMQLDTVAIEIDPQSVIGDGPILIKNVLIEAPALIYEVAPDGSSNLQKIQESIKAFATSLKGKGSPDDDVTGSLQQSPQSGTSAERKIIIKKLTIKDGSVKLIHAMLANKNLVNAKLPTIIMTDLGKDSGGLSGAALAQRVLEKITGAAIQIGQTNLVNELRDQGIESLKGAVEQSNIGKALGGIFGK